MDYNVKTPKTWAKLLSQWASSRDKIQFVEGKASNWPWTVKKIEVFVVFDAIFVVSERFRSKIQQNDLNNERTTFALHFSEENVAAFCFKDTSERLQKSRKIQTSSFLCNLCTFRIVLESEWWQTFNKGWTYNLVGFQRIICRLRLENDSKFTAKRQKCRNFCRFLTFSLNVPLRLESFRKMKASKSFR